MDIVHCTVFPFANNTVLYERCGGKEGKWEVESGKWEVAIGIWDLGNLISWTWVGEKSLKFQKNPIGLIQQQPGTTCIQTTMGGLKEQGGEGI